MSTCYHLTLFCVAGSQATQRAQENLQRFCEHELGGHCRLELIDVMTQPALALERKILVTPTLIRDEPKPERRVIGDFSDPHRLRESLGFSAH